MSASSVKAVPVTVVIPVYDGLDEVRACLESVRRWTPPSVGDRAVDLLVIEDGSPDPAIGDLLRSFAADMAAEALPVSVIHQPENLGFVRTANAGMTASAGDVVLLNADTVVTEGWLAQMAAVADEPFVATVTPLTNHGSICTLPAEVISAYGLDGDQPRIDDCARFVTDQSLHRRPELISGVGFCMWITRAALDVVGDFDEEAFGRGYGEEVDFCIRAGRAGFRHLADDGTFVFHHGGVSFGDESLPSQATASRVIHDRYRFFGRANRVERGDDPLRVPFAALQVGLHRRNPARPHVLHLLHAPPDAVGGTEAHVRNLVDLLGDDIDFSVFAPTASGFVVRTYWRTGDDDGTVVVDELLFPGAAHRVRRLEDGNVAVALQAVLDVLDVDVVHVQNLVNLSLAPFEVLAHFDGPVLCSIHDMFLGCPNHSVLYRAAVSCGFPDDPAACARCLPETTGFPAERLAAHRDLVAAAIPVVDRWIVPSTAALDHLARVYDLPDDRVEVIAHGALVDVDRLHRDPDPVLVHHEPLRLGFVGRGWAKKGLGTVNDLCRLVRDTTIEVHHFGPLVDDADPDLHRHGPFDSAVLPDLLIAAGINVVLLPGHVPETFSYVMTEALAAGIPVIGARHGALGERIRADGVGWTIDPERFDDLVELVTALDRCRDELWDVTVRVADTPLDRAADVAERYASLYRGPTSEDHA